MNKLDLHGKTYEEAETLIEDFILMNDTPFEVITGNSLQMKQVAEKYLTCYKLSSVYLNPNNLGCITVIDKL